MLKLNTHQQAIEKKAIEVAREVLRRHAADVDRLGSIPKEGFAALHEAGLMALMVPTEYGGKGGDVTLYSRIAEILGAECLSTALLWTMHSQQVAVITAHGTSLQKERVLTQIAEEGVFVASATTEQKGGGQILACESSLIENSHGLYIERECPIVSGGEIAEWILVTTRTSKEALKNSVSLLLVNAKDLHITAKTNTWDAMGVRGTRSVSLFLQGQVDHKDIIGEENNFREIAVRTLIPFGHIGWSSCWYGSFWGAYKWLYKQLKQDGRAGRRDLNSDLLAERLARIRADIDLIRALLFYTSHSYQLLLDNVPIDGSAFEKPEFNILINNLKMLVSSFSFDGLNKLVELAGVRNGYSKPSPIERAFRDVRSGSLMYANDKLVLANGKLSLVEPLES